MNNKEVQDSLKQVGIRLVEEPPLLSPEPMNNPEAAVRVLGKWLSEMDRELFCVVNLNTNLTPINMNVVSIGALNVAYVHPRETMKSAILSNSAYLMLVHNHLGSLNPSKEDIEITDRIQSAASLMGIPVLDHIIVGRNQEFFSLRENNVFSFENDISYTSEQSKLQWTQQMGIAEQSAYRVQGKEAAESKLDTIMKSLEEGVEKVFTSEQYQICDSPMVPRWKLESMADMIFQKFWKDRSGIIKIANEMLEDHYKDDREIDFQKEIEETKYKLEILDKKFDNLIDMRIAGEIDAAKFDEKKKALTDEKEKYEKILDSYQIDEEISDEEYNQRLQVLKYGLEKDFNFSTHSIPDEVIEAFVKEIIVYPDCFVWKLNIVDRDLKLKIAGRKKNPDVSLIESPAIGNCITGSNCQEERLIIVVSRLYIEASLEVH